MIETQVSLPELGLVAGTRAALGFGLGLLMADHWSPEQRRAIGWTLFAFGALTTVPLALPLAVLLSSIMTLGNLGETYELVAIKSAGISLLRFLRPLFFVSLRFTMSPTLRSDRAPFWLPTRISVLSVTAIVRVQPSSVFRLTSAPSILVMVLAPPIPAPIAWPR